MREFHEEPEVAGEYGERGDTEGTEGDIEFYEVSGDIAITDEVLGKLAANVLSLNQKECCRVAGIEIADELSGDEILGLEYHPDLMGFSLKKAFKKVKKAAGKAVNLAVNPVAQFKAAAKFVRKNPLAVIAPPVAAFKLLNSARKKNPSALANVLALRHAAQQPPQYQPQEYQQEYQAQPYEPVSPPANAAPEGWYREPANNGWYREDAANAYSNLQRANEIQNYAAEEYGDSHYYDPEGSYGEYADEPYELLGFSFKKLVKKAGYALDITKKDNPLRALVPAQVRAAADLVANANRGMKDAKAKVAAVNAAAQSGDPTAQQAAANIKVAEEAAKKAEREKLLKYGGIAAAGVVAAGLVAKVVSK